MTGKVDGVGLDFTAIDFETANGFRGSPCAVGLTKVRGGVVVEEASWLMRPPQNHDRFDHHNVRIHGSGTKRFNHPVVGELTLVYEELAVTAEPGLVLLVYTAEPGSPSAERLQLLASWAVPAEAPTTSN